MTISPTCLLACWDYLHDPDNVDTTPPYDDELVLDEDVEDEIEDSYICPIHGECDGPECVRC